MQQRDATRRDCRECMHEQYRILWLKKAQDDRNDNKVNKNHPQRMGEDDKRE
jgi:hypothetical protein